MTPWYHLTSRRCCVRRALETPITVGIRPRLLSQKAVQRDSSRASFGPESSPRAYTSRSLSARFGLAYYPVIAILSSSTL